MAAEAPQANTEVATPSYGSGAPHPRVRAVRTALVALAIVVTLVAALVGAPTSAGSVWMVAVIVVTVLGTAESVMSLVSLRSLIGGVLCGATSTVVAASAVGTGLVLTGHPEGAYLVVGLPVVLTVLIMRLEPRRRMRLKNRRLIDVAWLSALLVGTLYPVLWTGVQARRSSPTASFFLVFAFITFVVVAAVSILSIIHPVGRAVRGSPPIALAAIGFGLAELLVLQGHAVGSTSVDAMAALLFVLSFGGLAGGLAASTEPTWCSDGDVHHHDWEAQYLPVVLGVCFALRFGFSDNVAERLVLFGSMFLVAELASAARDRYRAERVQSDRAYHDSLTGLPNRACLMADLERMVSDRAAAAAVENAAPDDAYVVFVDLNGFKAVNDRLGHAAGDAVLIAVADRLREVVGRRYLVARLGGDEFVFVVTGDEATTKVIVSAALSAVAQPIRYNDRWLDISASAGVSRLGEDHAVALHEADLALYESKASEASRISWFNERMRDATEREGVILDSFLSALENDELMLMYQPIVDMRSGRWIGVESLLRWPLDDGEPIDPMKILQTATRLDLLPELNRWVLNRAAADLPRLRDAAGRSDLWVSVNVSVPQLLGAKFLDHARGACHLSGIAASGIVVELTEHDLPTDVVRVADVAKILRRFGFRVAIDDFGVGYSALAHLWRFAPDFIKLDREFVLQVKRSGRLIEHLVAACTDLGAEVIVEGIETELERDLIMHHNGRYGQGYLWQRPQPIGEMVATLRRTAPDRRHRRWTEVSI